MSVVSFNKNESNDKIKWLIEVKNNIKRNYKKMFDGNNDMYNSLWQQYVDINERLIKEGMPPIDLPGELDYPSIEEYIIHDRQEDYTEWHKRNFKPSLTMNC